MPINNRFAIVWTPLLMIAALAIGVLAYKYHRMTSPVALTSATLLQPRPLTPFALQDNKGNTFTDQNLLHHWTFLFFGYTHCPDICPTTLSLLNQVTKDMAGSKLLNNTEFVFVSVDPARDKPQMLDTYVHFFNPNFKGVTGTDSEIAKLTGNLGIVYIKVPNNKSPEDYAVDHSGALVLINPQGEYQAVFTPPLNAERIAKDFAVIAERNEVAG